MSLTKRIIPCLDINKGRVVKGIKFNNLYDSGDPVEIAQRYNEEGADEIIFLDITATSDNREIILPIIESVASKIFIPLTVGGGIRTLQDVCLLLNSGADKISINSSAVMNPKLVYEISNTYGKQCIVASIDVKRIISKNNNPNWEVYTHGGRKNTGINIKDWVYTLFNLGIGEILLTSIDKDGTKSGFDIQLIRTISNIVNVPIIASGGAGSLQDLVDVIKYGYADAVLAASIFHNRIYTIEEAKNFMHKQNIPVRL